MLSIFGHPLSNCLLIDKLTFTHTRRQLQLSKMNRPHSKQGTVQISWQKATQLDLFQFRKVAPIQQVTVIAKGARRHLGARKWRNRLPGACQKRSGLRRQKESKPPKKATETKMKRRFIEARRSSCCCLDGCLSVYHQVNHRLISLGSLTSDGKLLSERQHDKVMLA